MGISDLPEEVVDLVFYQVGGDDHDDTARRALYRTPFGYRSDSFTKTMVLDIHHRAELLLSNLRNDQKRLGRLVRSLDGLACWVADYVEAEGGQAEGIAAAERWYLEVLKSCPAPHFVEVNVSSVKMIRQVAEAISQALPTITGVKLFFDPSSLIESRTTLSETHKFLASLCPNPLSYIESLYLEWDAEVKGTISSLPISVRTVDVTTQLGSIDAVFPLLPAPTIVPPLRNLTIRFDGDPPSDLGKLEAVGRRVGSSLHLLDYEHFERSRAVHLLSYGRHHPGTALPPEAFRLFPVLTILHLRRTHGPSLALIGTLASHSPLLEIIDLVDSCWVSSSDRHSVHPQEIFPEQQVLACLLKFKHLKTVDFGILPTSSRLDYGQLWVELDQRRIKCSWEICEMESNSH
ncbi:hypothetical protein JCM5350_005551 [Sporobolomyces pararoseus]